MQADAVVSDVLPVVQRKIDFGCGPNKKEGFIGVDTLPFDGKVDVVMDIGKDQWPWEDESVDEVHSSHFIEHLDAQERIRFFNELYRVMKKDSTATIVVPHWSSGRAYGDLTHKWPPVADFFWYYLNAEWRKSNAPHVPLTCNFEGTWGFTMASPWNMKNTETQTFALTHYREVAQDVIATLKRK